MRCARPLERRFPNRLLAAKVKLTVRCPSVHKVRFGQTGATLSVRAVNFSKTRPVLSVMPTRFPLAGTPSAIRKVPFRPAGTTFPVRKCLPGAPGGHFPSENALPIRQNPSFRPETPILAKENPNLGPESLHSLRRIAGIALKGRKSVSASLCALCAFALKPCFISTAPFRPIAPCSFPAVLSPRRGIRCC